MKKWFSILALCLGMVFLSGCAGGEEPGAEGETQSGTAAVEKELVIDAEAALDIVSQAEEIFRQELSEMGGKFQFLRMQYLHGEPVQLWMEAAEVEAGPQGSFSPAGRTEEDGSGEEHRQTAKLYLFWEDGSRELLAEGIPIIDSRIFGEDEEQWRVTFYHLASDFGWYAGEDGACYSWVKGNNNGVYSLRKIDASGETAYEILLEADVVVYDLFQLSDGSTYVVLRDKGKNETRIASMDAGAGKISGDGAAVKIPGSGTPIAANYACMFGTGEDGGIYLNSPGNQGICRVDPSDGSVSLVLPFAGTTYTMGDSSIDMTRTAPIQEEGIQFAWKQDGLRAAEDGSVELLWHKWVGERMEYTTQDGEENYLYIQTVLLGVREKIALAASDRKTVTIRGASFSDWMKRRAARFNRTSAQWQVVLEEYAASNAADLEEYARLTSVQTASGGGPDMLYGDFMEGYLQGMAEKGALLDLAPLMAESGIRKEDYLPLVFDVWRDGSRIYGITPEGGVPLLYHIDARALGNAGDADASGLPHAQGADAGDTDASRLPRAQGTGEPGIAALSHALAAWEGDAALYGYDSAGTCLRHFLEGSGDLWGMVDWEKGTCDFGGELFAELLEVSKKYGYDERRIRPNLVRHTLLDDILHFDTREELEAAGRRICGPQTGAGCAALVNGGHTLAVNAASDSLEGAWEFLCFLLGGEAQREPQSFPVKRELLEEWARERMEQARLNADGEDVDASYIDSGELVKERKKVGAGDMTQERLEEYLEALGKVRGAPLRSGPVLDIICEEAGAYFDGSRSIEDVAEVITNRVGLYLAERQ